MNAKSNDKPVAYQEIPDDKEPIQTVSDSEGDAEIKSASFVPEPKETPGERVRSRRKKWRREDKKAEQDIAERATGPALDNMLSVQLLQNFLAGGEFQDTDLARAIVLRMALANCSWEDMAESMGTEAITIRELYGDVAKRGRAMGRVILQNSLYERAQTDQNPATLIFAGKAILNMSENQQINHTHRMIPPIVSRKQLSDDKGAGDASVAGEDDSK